MSTHSYKNAPCFLALRRHSFGLAVVVRTFLAQLQLSTAPACTCFALEMSKTPLPPFAPAFLFLSLTFPNSPHVVVEGTSMRETVTTTRFSLRLPFLRITPGEKNCFIAGSKSSDWAAQKHGHWVNSKQPGVAASERALRWMEFVDDIGCWRVTLPMWTPSPLCEGEGWWGQVKIWNQLELMLQPL